MLIICSISQPLGVLISAWRRGGDYTQGGDRHRSPPCIPHCALHSKTLQLNLGSMFIPAENRPFTRQSTPSTCMDALMP